MPRHLLLLCHADPSVRPKYETELGALPEPVDLVFVNNFIPGQHSAAYKQLAAELRDEYGRYLPRLLRRFKPPRPRADYASIICASFSAGYALWREVLNCPADTDQIDGLIGLDSWHSGYDSDGTASDSQLGGLVAMALRAKDSVDRPYICWLGHTDVPTYKRYASTTEVANEVKRLAGGVGGGFSVRAHNLFGNTEHKKEHSAALIGWGPRYVAEAMSLFIKSLSERAPTEPDTRPVLESLGDRCATLAIQEEITGIREVQGPVHNDRILQYLAGCMREGHNIGRWLQTDETAWCAAFASWCMAQCIQPSEQKPHQYRAAVRELWLDAMATEFSRSAERVRSGLYKPRRGDLWIMTRGGNPPSSGPDPFAATAGKGHVGRVTWFDSGKVVTVDGNVSDKITRVERTVDDANFVGVIAYPGTERMVPSDSELDTARKLWDLSNALTYGKEGDIYNELYDV